MTIEQRNITIGELCEGYFNDAEEGVVGYAANAWTFGPSISGNLSTRTPSGTR